MAGRGSGHQVRVISPPTPMAERQDLKSCGFRFKSGGGYQNKKGPQRFPVRAFVVFSSGGNHRLASAFRQPVSGKLPGFLPMGEPF